MEASTATAKNVQQVTQAVDWCVYLLVNNSRKELYYGASANFVEELESHVQRQLIATRQWHFYGDKVECHVLARALSPHEAFDQASRLNCSHMQMGYLGYAIVGDVAPRGESGQAN